MQTYGWRAHRGCLPTISIDQPCIVGGSLLKVVFRHRARVPIQTCGTDGDNYCGRKDGVHHGRRGSSVTSLTGTSCPHVATTTLPARNQEPASQSTRFATSQG